MNKIFRKSIHLFDNHVKAFCTFVYWKTEKVLFHIFKVQKKLKTLSDQPCQYEK